jgi:hyperosmotically inducible periplasmic protein
MLAAGSRQLIADSASYNFMKTAAVLALVITCSVPFVSACASGGAVNRTIDDATITTRVKTALLNDPVIDATKIDVNTAAGVVTLIGVVKSTEEETKAIELTRSVSGVRDVKSTLRVELPVTSKTQYWQLATDG